MTRVGTITVLALLAGCAGAPGPTAQPPTPAAPLVEEAPKIDDGPVRAVIEPFLAARWAYDADGIYDFLTKEDQAKPWAAQMTSPLKYIGGGHPQFAHWGKVDFEVLGIEMEPDVATVQVDVTSASTIAMARLMARSATAMFKFHRWMVKDMKARMGTQPYADFVPDRTVVTHTYRLEKIDGAWKVIMGWPEAQRILEISDESERREALRSFRGSEKGALVAAIVQRNRPKLDDETARLVAAIQEAESARQDAGFAESIAAYDELIADFPNLPEFVVQRRTELERLSDAQAARLAGATLRIGKVKVEKKGDNRVFTVEITNDGPELTNAEISIPAPTKQHPNKTYKQFTQRLKSGETKVVTLRRYDVRQDVPDTPTVVDVWYKDKAAHGGRPTEAPEFRRKRDDLQSGGRTRGTASRTAGRIRESVEAIDGCRGDDEAALDLLVAVDDAGRATVSAARPDPYVRCLQEVVDKIEFDVTRRSRRVIVHLLPPTHWSRI